MQTEQKKEMKAGFKDVGPELAAEFLTKNTMNRPTNAEYIAGLVTQMRNGNWHETGESISFAEDGTLLNGQNRLNAIILSGTTQKLLIVEGVDKAAFKYMDTGKTRSAADVVHIAGFKSSSHLASIAKTFMIYERDVLSLIAAGAGHVNKVRYGLTNQDILSYVTEHHEFIMEAFKLANSCYYKGRFLTVNEWALLYHVLSKKDKLQATAFLNAVAAGNTLKEGSFMLRLRNLLSEAKMSGRPYVPKVRLAMVFKAWNLYRTGRSKGSVKFEAGEEMPKPI